MTAREQFENELAAVVGRWVAESDLSASEIVSALLQTGVDVAAANSPRRRKTKNRKSK